MGEIKRSATIEWYNLNQVRWWNYIIINTNQAKSSYISHSIFLIYCKHAFG